jgi:hypothetical protein
LIVYGVGENTFGDSQKQLQMKSFIPALKASLTGKNPSARLVAITYTTLLVLFCQPAGAQNFSVAHPSICLLGNTGVEWDPVSQNIKPRNVGANELNWDVFYGSGIPKIITPPTQVPGHCFAWSGNQPSTNFPFNKWITVPATSCNGVDGEYSCVGGWPGGVTFRYKFNLPANTLLHLKWSIWASDWVQNIMVNNKMAYDSKVSPTGFAWNRATPVDFSWCDFKAGYNEILVYVRTANWGPSTPAACRVVGLKVESWGCGNVGSILGNTLVCAGTLNCYSATPHYVNLGYAQGTYTWTKPPGWPGGPQNNSTSGTLCATSGTNSGVITAMAYNPVWTGGNMTFTYYCLATHALSVTVVPPMTITPSSSGTLVCSGTPLTLTGSGATSYAWYAPGIANPVSTSPVLVINTSATGTYNYTLTGITANNCQYKKIFAFTVIPSPPVGIVASPTAICTGQCAVLTATGAVTYTWLTVPTTTVNPITVCPTVTTVYSVTGKGQNGCAKTATIALTVSQTPVISASANPTVVCAGDPVSLTASGGNNYTWSPGGSNSNPVVVNPMSTIVYTALGTLTNVCVGKGTVQVIVLQPPVVTVNPPQICTGISNTLTATGASAYNWTVGTTIPTHSTNTHTISVSLTSATPYTVCGQAQNNTCTACFFGTLTLGQPIPIVANNVTLCTNAGSCAVVSATTTQSAPATFTWFSGPPPGTVSAIGGTASVCPPSSLVYTVSATSTVSGCPNTATMAVTVATACCSQPTTGLTRITVLNALLPGATSYILDNSIVLTGNATIQNSEVWITPGVKITVPAGLTLHLNNAHLFACGDKMWQGIEVLDGGRVTTPQLQNSAITSFIEDAETAIDLSNISGTFSGPALDIEQIIFNKNYIGIRISNSSPAVTSLPLGINGCVFISHNVPFTTHPNPFSWPNAHVTGGLRTAINTTASLQPPYLNLGPPVNLKAPYTSQPGHIGIKIEDIGDPAAFVTSPGVEWGITYPGINITNDFNLFDGLGHGVDIRDANVTTINNVFQNMQTYTTSSYPNGFGGDGIHHEVTALMNTRLSLNGTKGVDLGNRFWDCYDGIDAKNVYELTAANCIFRSTLDKTNAFSLLSWPGITGIRNETNRFNFTVANSEFNNLIFGIYFTTPFGTPQPFCMNGTNTVTGVYADRLLIDQNYFGAQITSSTTILNEYMFYAMVLWSPNVSGWTNSGNNSSVVSNRLDRVFRGMYINSLEDHPLSVVGNSIYVIDNFVHGNPDPGVGIWLKNSTDQKTIASNTLHGQSSVWPNKTSLVWCENNQGNTLQSYPRVFCNYTYESNYGFEFDGDNSTALWEGNKMCKHYAGLALVNNGVIGMQGSSTSASDNYWEYAPPCDPWATPAAFWETFCDNSDPMLSPLWVWAPTVPPVPAGYWPTSNGFVGPPPASAYNFPASIFTVNAHNMSNIDCYLSQYPPVPGWRNSNITDVGFGQEQIDENIGITISPNPTSGIVNIKCRENSSLLLSAQVFELTGKKVLEVASSPDGIETLDISDLAPGIYLLSIEGNDGRIYRRKLIKTD